MAPQGFAAPWSPGPPTLPGDTYEVRAVAEDIFGSPVPTKVAFMNASIPQTRVLLEYTTWSTLRFSKPTRLVSPTSKPKHGAKARRLKLRRVRG